MTLEEAINHAQERATQDCSECAEDHQQLADWLTELKQYRELENNRLANLDNLTVEEAEREVEFVSKFIENNHRPPIFSDAIEITRKETIEKALAWIKRSLFEDVPEDLCYKNWCEEKIEEFINEMNSHLVQSN